MAENKQPTPVRFVVKEKEGYRELCKGIMDLIAPSEIILKGQTWVVKDFWKLDDKDTHTTVVVKLKTKRLLA